MFTGLLWRVALACLSCWRSRVARTGALLGLVALALSLLVASPTVSAPFLLPDRLAGVSVSTTSSRLYLTMATKHAMWAFDGAGTRLIGVTDLGPGTLEVLAVNPATEHVYVLNLPYHVEVLAGASMTRLASVALDRFPTDLAINPLTNRVYVVTQAPPPSEPAGTVMVLDGWDDTVVAEIPVGKLPMGVAVNPASNRVYVANALDNTVSVIDGATDTAVATIPVGPFPHSVAVNTKTNRVYVSDQGAAAVTVLDGARDVVLTTIPVGKSPGSVGVNETTNRIYVANNRDTVSVLDGATSRLLTTLAIGGYPVAIAVNPATSRVYVSDIGDNALWLIQDRGFGLPTARLIARAAPAAPSSLPGQTICPCR